MGITLLIRQHRYLDQQYCEKMKIKSLVLITFTSLLISTGCKQVINIFSFHPDTTNVIPSDRLPVNVQEIYIKTIDNINIQSYLIPNKSSDKLLIYFHGNAGNIGHRLPDLIRLNSFGVNVLGMGYRGYGKSQGSPSEEGIYMDGKAAIDYASKNLGFREENIIIFGRSIGTTVAVNVSQNIKINKLILVTPLTSGKDYAKALGLGLFSSLAGNSFDNINKIERVLCPILVIHGDQDKVVPFEMGEALFNKAKSKKSFIKIEGANHNNLSTRYQNNYWSPIYAFIKGQSIKQDN